VICWFHILLFKCGTSTCGRYAWVALALATLGFFLIGAYDDVQKLRGKSNYAGHTPLPKLGLQCLVSTAFCVWLVHGPLTPPPTSLNLAGLGVAALIPIGRWFWALSAFAMVGLHNLNPVVSHSLKAPGFNP
jgi:UDP-N-acetylmuramyl pentapeptide phosphotransferase/UDP-N-acetylglucosamine-1-phosphate transferase